VTIIDLSFRLFPTQHIVTTHKIATQKLKLKFYDALQLMKFAADA